MNFSHGTFIVTKYESHAPLNQDLAPKGIGQVTIQLDSSDHSHENSLMCEIIIVDLFRITIINKVSKSFGG
jgi:hypothetical protein